jgi:hypothetical protein
MLAMTLLSLTSDGAAEVMLSMVRCRNRVILVMTLSNRRWLLRDRGDIGRGVISLLSHAGNGVAEVILVVA